MKKIQFKKLEKENLNIKTLVDERFMDHMTYAQTNP